MTVSSVRKPKVWMNVTTSSSWNRPAVGIIRVERELARALKALYAPGEFGLCIFDGDDFVPYTSSVRLAEAVGSDTLVWPDTSRRLVHASRFDHETGSAQWTPKASETLQDAQRRSIAAGDIIISIGLDWDYAYVDTLKRLSVETGVKIVTCCYDLIPILYPQFAVPEVAQKFARYLEKVTLLTSLMLCISERSEQDYRAFAKSLGVMDINTVVIPLGDNVLNTGTAVVQAHAEDKLSADVLKLAQRPFILFVSTIERRKNHEVLYRAYHLLAQQGHADRLPKLVFVGMPAWGVSDLLKDIELDPLTAGLIVQLNHVSDDELAHLYDKAYFCLYPSLYEGWGLPIGEALSFGKVVLASAQGSIPEVGGELVTYLDPWDPQSWADAILALVDDAAKVISIEAEVRRRYRPRAWRNTAAVVKNALEPLRQETSWSLTLYPGYDLNSFVGSVSKQAIRSTGAAGVLLFGPRRALPPGTYDIVVSLDKFAGEGEMCFALRSALNTRHHGIVELVFEKQESIGYVAILRNVCIEQQIDDFEIFSQVSQDLEVSINKVTIRKVASA